MNLGFIGLKFSGKSTLFELLTQGKYESVKTGIAEYHRGKVVMPDNRINALSEIFEPKKTTYADFDCVDIMGLPASMKTDQGSKYLEAVRQTDGLVAVIQVFDGYDLAGKPFKINPLLNVEQLIDELVFADLVVAETRLDKVLHHKQRGAPQYNAKEHDILQRCKDTLENGQAISDLEINTEDDKQIRGFQFLSKKPIMVVLNCDEAHYNKRDELLAAFHEGMPDIPVTAVSALAEKEIQELDEDDRLMFMEELGIDEPAIHHVIKAAYSALGLLSFFTVGEDEVRAWTVLKGATAPEAAGAIHSDLQKGFIRAEVVHYGDFMQEKSYAKAKSAGLLKLEGKEYKVEDGDILNIRFNI